MSSSNRSPSGVSTKPAIYGGFSGVDGSQDIRTLDTGENQALVMCDSAFCDQRGQITRDPGATHIMGEHPVKRIIFYSGTQVAYAEQDGAAINIVSEAGHKYENAFTRGSVVNATIFGRKAHFFAANQSPLIYDGTSFSRAQSPSLNDLKPAFATSVGRRLAVAGIRGKETEVHLSRADDPQLFADDEADDSENVLRGGIINIANQLETAEQITGISKFEQSRLAVFTSDRVLIYMVDPNIDRWALDDKASINVGCVSHATIQRAGTDVIFCSRAGVHSLRRSVDNGITIETSPFSDRIDILYRKLVASVDNPEDISAVYDPDMRQYHIFFPQPGGVICKRLTLTIRLGDAGPAWSTSEFLYACSGTFLAGRLVYGTRGGIFDVARIENPVETNPVAHIRTPMLFHGNFDQTKSVRSITLQAAGKGVCNLEVIDDEGNVVHSDVFEVDDNEDDNSYGGVALSREYERRMHARYRGAQYHFSIEGDGLCRIIGFSVNLQKD